MANSRGVFGKLIAWAVAHKEQARKTLHGHYHLWVEDFKESKRALFNKNESIKRAAIAEYENCINCVMSASYGQDLEVIHRCGEHVTIDQKKFT